MGVRYLKSHIHKCMGYTGAKVNLSREARSTDDWFMMNSRPRGLVFDGDGYCYWTTDAPWYVTLSTLLPIWTRYVIFTTLFYYLGV